MSMVISIGKRQAGFQKRHSDPFALPEISQHDGKFALGAVGSEYDSGKANNLFSGLDRKQRHLPVIINQ